jgi:SAM-dependent methyltransferase
MTVAVMPTDSEPWQLQMFRRSLKKQLKLNALLPLIERLGPDDDCLLLTCGDNNGALNYYFRAGGGRWTWGDVAGENLQEMALFLGEPVYHVLEAEFPFAQASFDCVVAIDVLEHLPEDRPFLEELQRVLRTGGRAVVTVPNGDPGLLANRLKWRLGMTPEVYGHTRAGYTVAELQTALEGAGLKPLASGGYSRFFTEMVEMVVNYGYVFLLSRKSKAGGAGHIAPTTAGELKQHGAAYRLYRAFFPLMRLISSLDRFLPAGGDGAVIVVGVKEPA